MLERSCDHAKCVKNMVFSIPRKIHKTSVSALILQYNDVQSVYIKCVKAEFITMTLSYDYHIIVKHVCDGRVTRQMCENMVFSIPIPRKIHKTSASALILILQHNDVQYVYIKCAKAEVLTMTLSYIDSQTHL